MELKELEAALEGVLFAAGEPVGVDIEHIRPVSERAMRRLADVTTERAFFQSWVRREARAKRSGAGVGTMLASETPLQPGGRLSLIHISEPTRPY